MSVRCHVSMCVLSATFFLQECICRTVNLHINWLWSIDGPPDLIFFWTPPIKLGGRPKIYFGAYGGICCCTNDSRMMFQIRCCSITGVLSPGSASSHHVKCIKNVTGLDRKSTHLLLHFLGVGALTIYAVLWVCQHQGCDF